MRVFKNKKGLLSRGRLGLLIGMMVACNGRPDGGVGKTEISGVVFVSGPVEGARVQAFELSENGDFGKELASDESTDRDGNFQLDIGAYSGLVVIQASGVGARWEEPATGASAQFQKDTILRSAPAFMQDGTVRVGAEFNRSESLVVGPVSELAVSYALARFEERGGDLQAAFDESFRLFQEHADYNFWEVVPRVLDENSSQTFGDDAWAGLLHAGLSFWGRTISASSSASGDSVSALSVLEALRDDVTAGPIFDGEGAGRRKVELGDCRDQLAGRFCEFSSQSPRGAWAEASALFLAHDVNKSGFSYTDVSDRLEDMSASESVLFKGRGGKTDTTPPEVFVEGLLHQDTVVGNREFTVLIKDAFEMGELLEFTVGRGDNFKTDGLFVVGREETATEIRLQVRLRSTDLPEGPVSLLVRARDKAGNETEVPYVQDFFTNNLPEGSVTGTVFAGGRVDGALVEVFDITGGIAPRLLGEAVTGRDGRYLATIEESPLTQTLLIQATVPPNAATGVAKYTEAATGDILRLGTDQILEVAISDYRDGDSRQVHITPLTTIATAYARGIAAKDGDFDAAVDTAFEALEDHFDAGMRINLREVPPADITNATEMTSLNAQALYGLILAGFGEMARQQGEKAGFAQGVVGTMTLVGVLATDIKEASAGHPAPLFDGVVGATELSHAGVRISSYETRDLLAYGVADFLDENAGSAGDFRHEDLKDFLIHISVDDDPRLFPGTELARIFDRDSPTIKLAATPNEIKDESTAKVIFDKTRVIVNVGDSARIPLENLASFSKLRNNYGADGANLPTWRVFASDEISEAKETRVRFRVLARTEDGGEYVPISGWKDADLFNGAGWTHEIKIHAGLADELLHSGDFEIEIFALDRPGNQSQETVKIGWHQEILAPPVKITEDKSFDPFLGIATNHFRGGVLGPEKEYPYQEVKLHNPYDFPLSLKVLPKGSVEMKLRYEINLGEKVNKEDVLDSCEEKDGPIRDQFTYEDGGGCFPRIAGKENHGPLTVADAIKTTVRAVGPSGVLCEDCSSIELPAKSTADVTLYLTGLYKHALLGGRNPTAFIRCLKPHTKPPIFGEPGTEQYTCRLQEQIQLTTPLTHVRLKAKDIFVNVFSGLDKEFSTAPVSRARKPVLVGHEHVGVAPGHVLGDF